MLSNGDSRIMIQLLLQPVFIQRACQLSELLALQHCNALQRSNQLGAWTCPPGHPMLALDPVSDVASAHQVYSLDWDKQYLEDEAALRAAGGYDAADTQLLDPLPPGAPLWSDLQPAPAPSSDEPQLAPPEAGADAASSLGGSCPACIAKV